MKTAHHRRRPSYNRTMSDFIYVGVVIVFFALAAAFVGACDRMIGDDDTGFER